MYPTIEEAVENRLAIYFGPPGKLLSPLLLMQLPLRAGVDPAQLYPYEAMSHLAAPVLVIGGEMDRHTPLSETRRIYDAAPQPKQLWIVSGAAHVDFHEFARAEYEQRVGELFATYLNESDGVLEKKNERLSP